MYTTLMKVSKVSKTTKAYVSLLRHAEVSVVED